MQTNEQTQEFLAIVHSEARRMVRRAGRFFDYDELVSLGNLGLTMAMSSYTPERHDTFFAYARLRIRGAMVDGMRRNDMAPRRMRTKQHDVRGAAQYLERKFGRKATVQEVADYLELDASEVHNIARAPSVISLDPKATLRATSLDPEEAYLYTQRVERLREAIASLPDRERKIIEWHYGEEVTFTEIGRRLGVTQGRVSQIHNKLKRTLQARVAA